jgi:hypothetical protein
VHFTNADAFLSGALMQLSSPMNMVASPLCPWLKRCQSGRGSLFCKIRRVTCRTYRSAGPPGSSAVPQTPPSSREAARGGVRELVEKHGSGR